MSAVLVPANVFTVSVAITNPGAVTNLNLQSAATKGLVIIRAGVELAQATIPSAANARIDLVRFTAAPTVTSIAASTFLIHDPSNSDPSCTAGHTASAAGTVGDTTTFGWGSSTGWMFDWAPTPEEYLVIPAGTANGFGLRHTTAPPAGVYTFHVTAAEIG